jgi:hypothetical protein
LHGSLKKFEGEEWLDSRYSIEATLEAVGKSGEEMQFELGKRYVFNSILQNHDLVVVGYSGYDDFDIGHMLRTIQSDKKIIWINYNNELEKHYTWHDLENVPRDKNGDFLKKEKSICMQWEHHLPKYQLEILIISFCLIMILQK